MHTIVNHPIVKVKLSRMRNKNTDSRDFRSNLLELSQFMAYEATKDYQLISFDIESPIAKTKGFKLKENICLIPILRAGLGMVDGFKEMIPAANIGHIGLYRDEKKQIPIEYYCKLPENISQSNVIILDPMLATGHSANEAIKIIKKYHPKSIKFVCIVSCPEGIEFLEKSHQDVEIYTASIDEKLSKDKYIIPGLGDAGDRLFGTK